MNIPEDLKYAETHEWVRVNGTLATVGISEHAQAELSDIVFVEMPKVGAVFSAGDVVAVVESVKAASDIYTPVSGEIMESNTELMNNPALINADPYEAGWIFKIALTNAQELNELKDATAYREQIA